MTKILKLHLYSLFSLLVMLSCKQSGGTTIDTPGIVAGTSKLTGRIISPNDTNQNDIFVNIIVLHSISGEYVKYKALVDQSGKFSIDVDVETTTSLVAVYTTLNRENPLYIKLTSGGVTNLDIAYNSDFSMKNINVTPAMNQYDVTEGFKVMGKMIEYKSGRKAEPLYNKSTDYFLNYAKNILSERLGVINKDTLISKELKEVLSRDMRLFIYNAHVFNYEGEMMVNYGNTNGDKNKKPDIQKIDRSYFRFLKDFNLNDPGYLNCYKFSEVQNKILQDETLGLPAIGESDIPAWLAKVKAILSDLVGFDNGPYYDILTANAYGKQLNEELRPLSEKQKENITNYWKKGEIAKILLRKNQQVVELDKFKSPAVVNDISSVPPDKVMETIVAKHKNKVVFVDLWATWCAPCLDAMQQFRPTKNDFRDKDIAFVYLTDGSSPRKLWEEKIKGIGDEHYYLTDAQWEYVMDHFEFEYIPSYVLYNKEGVFTNKFTAFPGNEELKEKINSLL